jgi:hypothetical protein
MACQHCTKRNRLLRNAKARPGHPAPAAKAEPAVTAVTAGQAGLPALAVPAARPVPAVSPASPASPASRGEPGCGRPATTIIGPASRAGSTTTRRWTHRWGPGANRTRICSARTPGIGLPDPPHHRARNSSPLGR